MSNDATPPRARIDCIARPGEQLRYGLAALRRHGWRMALLFALILLPLWAFGELAEEVREGEAFFFDKPLLEWAHGWHSPALDAFFVLVSKLGYEWGVVPVDVLLVAALGFRRRMREGLFAGVALIGSALLNLGAKHHFGRVRPSLWESIAPESTLSFPSGHAMGSMTLASVLVLLAWPTRARWPMLFGMVLFVLLVGGSRVYLGVHYPSDVLAGWAAGLAWAAGVYAVIFRGGKRPWQRD